MNAAAEFEHWLNPLPTGTALNDAIDVIARLTEQAERMAGKGPEEQAMSDALGATFGYLVAYLHHLAIDQREPRDAFAKAAKGIADLEISNLEGLYNFVTEPDGDGQP